jgi:hypothetical protein
MISPATRRSRPATRFAGYQIRSSDRVFAVRKPYRRLAGHVHDQRNRDTGYQHADGGERHVE